MNWSKERRQNPANPDVSAVMEPIAHSLTEQQIASIASYLNYLAQAAMRFGFRETSLERWIFARPPRLRRMSSPNDPCTVM